MRPIDADSLLDDLNHDIKFLDSKLGGIGSASRTLRTLRAIIENRLTLEVSTVIHAHWEPSSPERRTLIDAQIAILMGLALVHHIAPTAAQEWTRR